MCAGRKSACFRQAYDVQYSVDFPAGLFDWMRFPSQTAPGRLEHDPSPSPLLGTQTLKRSSANDVQPVVDAWRKVLITTVCISMTSHQHHESALTEHSARTHNCGSSTLEPAGGNVLVS